METERFEQFEEAVSYILEIPRFSAKNDAAMTSAFLEMLGEPDTDIVIHVAGTNGKGSTCAFLNSVYMKMGKKTGLFTSPHLVDIRERIMINGEMISREDFVACTNRVMEAIETFQASAEGYHPSFFEFIFFVAIVYFGIKNVDVAIYETGLGGRLDATNSLKRKSICVINEIGFDHMEYLGNTLEEIATEKAGIIKTGVPVVFWNGKPECNGVILKKAEDCGSKTYGIGPDDISKMGQSEKCIDFSYKYGYDIFSVHTYAIYQIFNAAVALQTLQVLHGDEIVTEKSVKDGICEMQWPGRMEEIGENIFIDGGHNVDGVEAFLKTVKEDGCRGRRYLVFSAVADKQVEKIAGMITESGLFDRISLCEMTGSRARSLENLYGIFKNIIDSVDVKTALITYEDAVKAYEGEKVQMSGEDRLYICGSLYLVGTIKEYIGTGDRL